MTALVPAAVDPASLAPGDQARFWRERRHRGLECLSASFRKHRYPLHAHDTYAIGVIVTGCETYRVRGVRHYAGPGAVCLVNPGDVHDGEPHAGFYAYRMTYPSIALLRDIVAQVTGRGCATMPFFPEAQVRDATAAALFRRAHEQLERRGERLAADECLVAAYASLLMRHARDASGPARLGREHGSVARVRAVLDARYADDVELATLARVADLSSFHLLRAFRRETGLTPHAYLMNRRVNAARDRLAGGDAPADVAAACGFFDQSHLTRVFKAHTGVTPGAFRER